ncbi:hypothetical protein JW949_04285 [Candidatus Woesearchaeota archaeon]|nr:hypothetical protein [Candidatus Woesearchaeota archaeon]
MKLNKIKGKMLFFIIVIIMFMFSIGFVSAAGSELCRDSALFKIYTGWSDCGVCSESDCLSQITTPSGYYFYDDRSECNSLSSPDLGISLLTCDIGNCIGGGNTARCTKAFAKSGVHVSYDVLTGPCSDDVINHLPEGYTRYRLWHWPDPLLGADPLRCLVVNVKCQSGWQNCDDNWDNGCEHREGDPETNCGDGVDNDCDGRIDCKPGIEDPDCNCGCRQDFVVDDVCCADSYSTSCYNSASDNNCYNTYDCYSCGSRSGSDPGFPNTDLVSSSCYYEQGRVGTCMCEGGKCRCDGDWDPDCRGGTKPTCDLDSGNCQFSCNDNYLECNYNYDDGCEERCYSGTECNNKDGYTCVKPNSGDWKWTTSVPSTETNCDDGADNDCDGLYDCDDPDCDGISPCVSCEYYNECDTTDGCGGTRPNAGGPPWNECDLTSDRRCGTETENDFCSYYGNCCSDGIDNDCDNLYDCDDPDCDGISPCDITCRQTFSAPRTACCENSFEGFCYGDIYPIYGVPVEGPCTGNTDCASCEINVPDVKNPHYSHANPYNNYCEYSLYSANSCSCVDGTCRCTGSPSGGSGCEGLYDQPMCWPDYYDQCESSTPPGCILSRSSCTFRCDIDYLDCDSTRGCEERCYSGTECNVLDDYTCVYEGGRWRWIKDYSGSYCDRTPIIESCSITNGFFAPGESVTLRCDISSTMNTLDYISAFIWAGECNFGNCEATRAWETSTTADTVYFNGYYDTDTPDKMPCISTGTSGGRYTYRCTKTFTLSNINDDFYNKALAMTVRVQTMTEGFSEWYDMYDSSDPVWFPRENCNNGIDDDNDGKIDCGDEDCYKKVTSTNKKSAVCGKQPPGVNRAVRDTSYSSPDDEAYCSQGDNPLDPDTYGRCCPSGQYWNGVKCVDAAECQGCDRTPFTTAWWADNDCFTYSGGKITYSCHPTDFFGDDEYHKFPVKII